MGAQITSPMDLPVIMHVNYCEQGQTLNEMCCKAAEWGFDGIEFRRGRDEATETPEQYLDCLRESVEAAGLKTVLFGSPGWDFMSDSADERERQLQEGLSFYRLAAERFSLTVCNTMSGSLMNPDRQVPANAYASHGSAVARDEHFQWAAEGLQRLGELAAELGFKLALETHPGYLHDRPSPTRRLLDLVDSEAVGVNLDYANMSCFPDNPPTADVIAALASRIFMVHLKNGVWVGEQPLMTSLADGGINHRVYLGQLLRSGFTGALCLESPRPGDREWFAREDLAYTRSLLEELAR